MELRHRRQLYSSPAVANGVVFVGTYPDQGYGPGILYALNARTGALRWSHKMASIFSSPAVANGVVYVASWDGKVYAFGLKQGQE